MSVRLEGRTVAEVAERVRELAPIPAAYRWRKKPTEEWQYSTWRPYAEGDVEQKRALGMEVEVLTLQPVDLNKYLQLTEMSNRSM